MFTDIHPKAQRSEYANSPQPVANLSHIEHGKFLAKCAGAHNLVHEIAANDHFHDVVQAILDKRASREVS